MPARSDGSISSRMLRSSAAPWAVSARRGRRTARPRAPGGRSRRARPGRPRAAPRRSRRRRRRGRSGRAAPGARGAAAPAGRGRPGRPGPGGRGTLLQQPAQRRVQVAVVEEVVGDLLEDRCRRRGRSRPGCRPTAVAEPGPRHGATVPVTWGLPHRPASLEGGPGRAVGAPGSRGSPGGRMVGPMTTRARAPRRPQHRLGDPDLRVLRRVAVRGRRSASPTCPSTPGCGRSWPSPSCTR